MIGFVGASVLRRDVSTGRVRRSRSAGSFSLVDSAASIMTFTAAAAAAAVVSFSFPLA